jgi:GDPmannose 4,6-dehydratase
MKKELITGINGQDGSYLSEFLIEKGNEVYSILKSNSVAENQTFRLDNIYKKINLYYGDLTNMSSLISVTQKVMSDEIYNVSAQSHDYTFESMLDEMIHYWQVYYSDSNNY